MIPIKTAEEIEIMRQAGHSLAQVMKKVSRAVRPGVSTLELDNLAAALISQSGAQSAFKGYLPEAMKSKNQAGYPATLCTSLNSEVVHGIPTEVRILKSGDIVGLDCGLMKNSYFADMAVTMAVGQINPLAKKLLTATKHALDLAIKKIKPGVYLGDISATIQKFVEENGFSVVRELTGHGIGKKLHEKPAIFNFGQKGTGPILEAGMVLAIEPMVNAGKWQVKTAADGWTIVTADGSLSVHFEHTVLVTKKGAEVLTM
jgi:methionyl aminopeptidase